MNAFLAPGINSWKDQSIREALKPLQKVAEQASCAIVLVGHLNKSQDASALHRIGGSIGLPAAARSVLVLAPDPSDPDGPDGTRRVLAHAKSNVGELMPTIRYEVESIELDADGELIETARLREDGFSDYEASDLFKEGPSEKHTGSIDEAVGFLRDLLSTGPRSAASARDKASREGHSGSTLKRAKKALGIKSRKFGFGDGWYWVLPPQDLQQP